MGNLALFFLAAGILAALTPSGQSLVGPLIALYFISLIWGLIKLLLEGDK